MTSISQNKPLLWLCIALIAIWMLAGGVGHMIAPESFFPIVPDFLPELFVVYASGIVEIIIGIAVLIPRTRALAGLAFAGLCLAFLPLHLWDFWRPDPVFSPWWAALIRVCVQFGLMAAGLYVFKRGKTL